MCCATSHTAPSALSHSGSHQCHSSKRPCQTYLGNFHEYNVYVWRVGVYWNTCVKAKLFFFINPFFKKPLSARGRGRRLPNPSHDCSLSRPSHTWTCHEFLWKRNAKKTGKKKSRSARCCFSPAHVYPAREPRARRAAFGVDCATPYVTGFVPTNRSRAPPKRAPKKGTPLDQSEQCSLGACTQRHMARIRCPCERARGSGTLLLCQM